MNDTMQKIIHDAHDLAKAAIAPDLVQPCVETIARRLERLVKKNLSFEDAEEEARDLEAKTITVEKKNWLELPRNLTLKRFSNTKRETHFVGQYHDDNRLGNPNPRRVYTIDVVPMLGENDERHPDDIRAFEATGRVDGHELFRLVTMHGRAVAEYLGIKSLKAWLNYCGSRRRGKVSRKLHNKRNRANRRARKRASQVQG